LVTAILVTGLLSAVGMNRPAAAEETAAGDEFKLAEQPKDAADVKTVRSDVKDQDEVTVVGRIGGRVNPWIKGAAAFSIVDRSLTPCNEIEGDTCKTPWDYCCESDLAQSTVLVMFVDADGKLVKQDARELLGVKELDTLFIQGKAKRDKQGNVTIMASKVFVPTDESETTQ
jgi:hypothetical protein